MAVNARMMATLLLRSVVGDFAWDGVIAVKVILMKSGFAEPDQDAELYYSDVLASELDTGDGYTEGGVTLTYPVTKVDYTAAPDYGGTVNMYADDTVWDGLTATFRYALLYYDVAGAASVKPIIGYVKFSNSTDVSCVNQIFTIQWNGGRVFTNSLDTAGDI